MADIVLTQPTAYIYNGYRLPELAILDIYPYAIIFKRGVTKYEALCSASAITITTNDDGEYLLTLTNPYCFCNYDSKNDTNWRYGSVYTSSTNYIITNYKNPMWSTHKITYPDGTVYTAASSKPSALYEGNTTVEDFAIDLYSWTIGLTFGLVDGLGFIDNNMYEEDNYVAPPEPTPIAYTYNGMKLSQLPDWDKETYPYVMLSWSNGSYIKFAYLYIFSEPHHLTVANSDGIMAVGVQSGETYLQSYISILGGGAELCEKTFSTPTLKTATSTSRFTTSPDWSNYDILNSDGTVYLLASDIEPVYE